MGFRRQDLAIDLQALTQGGEWVAREFGGLGLGLAISKATVEAHGGTIAAESGGRGQGVTFTVHCL
ncbi:MAG: ATP-binding protein [Burkholderiaceae bacterium]